MADERTERLVKKLVERFGPGVIEVLMANSSPAVQEEAAKVMVGPATIKLFQALVDAYGPEVLDIVAENTSAMACLWLQRADIPERNLNAVFTQLWDGIAKDPGFVFTAERTPQKVVFNVTACPHTKVAQENNAAGIGYALMCAYDQGFCQGLNPQIRFTRSKTLMMGDDCCNHTYELDEE